MKNKLIKSIVFIVVGMILMSTVQYVLVQKFDYPVNTEGITKCIKGFYKEDKDSIDVIYLGTSHMAHGISPMEVYDEYGITGYNLATSRQPIEVSYTLLQEAVKCQNPKVVVLDVSNLFFDKGSNEAYRYVLDSLPFSWNKLNLMLDYEKSVKNPDSLSSLLFPIAKYHNRWNELVANDFSWLSYQKSYYAKGYIFRSQIEPFGTTVEQMNQMGDNKEKVSISTNNIECLLKIKKLCDDEGIELLLTKIPSIYAPDQYDSAWTEKKAKVIREVCQKNDISYWDILYDAGMNIDYVLDSMDGGIHFNIIGAEKVSNILGKYLEENYDISKKENLQFEEDMFLYKKVKQLALLELEQEFTDYLNNLNNRKEDYIIVVAAPKKFSTNLTSEECQKLSALGIKGNLENLDEKSLIAIVDGGQVVCNLLSNETIDYSYTDENGNNFCVSDVSIKVEDDEYSQGKFGINIVVFDKKTQGVVDSVSFSVGEEKYVAERNNKSTEKYLKRYEDYYIKNRKKI